MRADHNDLFMTDDDFKKYACKTSFIQFAFTRHCHYCSLTIFDHLTLALNSADENKFLTSKTSQEMIEFLTRVPLADLSKSEQLQLSAFIEGFTMVCLFHQVYRKTWHDR